MSGERLLVVDDEPRLRRTLDLLLTGHGYEVAVAEDGEAALAAFAARPADALLLDLMMPRLGGLDVIRRLRPWSANLVNEWLTPAGSSRGRGRRPGSGGRNRSAGPPPRDPSSSLLDSRSWP